LTQFGAVQVQLAFIVEKNSDPLTEIIAKAIIEIAQTGVHDPIQLRKLALEKIGAPPAE
jgi:hypothetical protein